MLLPLQEHDALSAIRQFLLCNLQKLHKLTVNDLRYGTR